MPDTVESQILEIHTAPFAFTEGVAIGEAPPPPGGELYERAVTEPPFYDGFDIEEGHRPPALWGGDNQEPQRLNALAMRNPLIAAAMEFKASLLTGQGIVPVRRVPRDSGGGWNTVPAYDATEVTQALEEWDADGWFAEQCLDRVILGNVFPEVTIQDGRVTAIGHREAVFSRWERTGADGIIRNHYYATEWSGGYPSPDLQVTPVLPELDTYHAARSAPDGRYILPVRFPSPGNPYYAHPWWASIVRSGWAEYVDSIPTYKRMLLENGAILRYHIRIHPEFWRQLYSEQGATTQREQQAAKARWYESLNAFLKDTKNTGRAFVSTLRDGGGSNGAENLVTIEPIKSDAKGGELIQDMEETSNILAYAMGVHPSLIGAAPGKNGSINGTEARELFVMKQALLHPERQRLLRPLYLAKRLNNWPEDIFFTVANMELTRIDENTGARRQIGQQALDES